MNSQKQWFDIQPLEIQTPNGVQVVSKMHFNGYEPTLHLIFANDKNEVYELDCTFNHPLRTEGGVWVEAEYIEDYHLFDGGYKLVSSLLNQDKIPTFDFEVPEEHCYILESGIVSHNTATIMGGVSEGINPDPAMVFTQMSAAGEMERVNPTLLDIMKSRGKFNKKVISELKSKMGSVQHVDWLTDDEKLVFKTAFEINQEVVIRLASQRAKYIDQWQSLNLFFSADESEGEISRVHEIAFKDENILALYYIYSSSGVQASNGECLSCQ